MQEKPHESFRAAILRRKAAATSTKRRASLVIGDITAGPFHGQLKWTFFAGQAFVLQEALLSTKQDGVAYLFDMGLECRDTLPQQMSWQDSVGEFQQATAESIVGSRTLAVRQRTVHAGFPGGTVSVFPPPHRFFYPLDFSNNLKNIWLGPGYGDRLTGTRELAFGFGLRHDPQGDRRFVPWFNAPPGTRQELGMFLRFSTDSPLTAHESIARLSRNDRFARLAGHVVFSSHYHVEHTRELLEAQSQKESRTDREGQLPSGQPYRIPARLQNTGFARVFRDQGIDIVHLAEFHFGKTPRMNASERTRHLQLLHAECQRLSDDKFLLLPGEEPNVHLGGHWISFFPSPVYWVLNRPEGTPFVKDHPQLGKVYHVGSEADVLRLLQTERGLAWTAHPRIKSSTGYPDRYRQNLFFESDRFLGAAWKAMPADLSEPRLGGRVLDLLDDMSNWGLPKYVLGEVDVFKIEPDHELYGHMNVNYLRLPESPRFVDGWQTVLDALRAGAFFVTTGEVLISDFTVNDRQSGQLVNVDSGQPVSLRVGLKWTFPLSYAVIISGDGEKVYRQRVDLSWTDAFGEDVVKLDVDASGRRWIRVEVWDVATNGAFTQPVWLK